MTGATEIIARNSKRDISNLVEASSSNGRASDSKSEGWGFKSLLACHVVAQ